MDSTVEFALLARLREVAAGFPATEVDLRRLAEEADAWARTLEAQIQASEERLAALVDDASSPLSGVADELRRIAKLRPELNELRAQLDALEQRSRELRTRWLLEQASSQPPADASR
jgi:chromosome segregation ATPase